MSLATRLSLRRAALASALFLLATPALRAQAAAPKFGVIDVQEIVTESQTGKKVFQELETFGKNKQTELDGKRKEVEDLRAKLDAGKNTLAETKVKEMAEQIEQKGIALERALDDAKREFARRQQELLSQVEQKVLPIINQIGQEGAYTMIFRKFDSGLIYAESSTDITKQVIQKLDAAQAAAGK